MTHKHLWQHDLSRIHGDPTRFFVICACGETAQAVMKDGEIRPFQTNVYHGGSNVISFRVNDAEYANYLKDKSGCKRRAKKMVS